MTNDRGLGTVILVVLAPPILFGGKLENSRRQAGWLAGQVDGWDGWKDNLDVLFFAVLVFFAVLSLLVLT